MIEKFNKGDPAAENAIFDLFAKKLVAFAFRWTSDTMAAEDIASDSFLKLFSYPKDHFNDLDSIKRYLYFITRNACIDYLRKTIRDERNKMEYLYAIQSAEEIEDKVKFEQELDEQFELIMKAIEIQPPKRKLVLKYLIEFKEPIEIARLMNITVSVVYGHRNAFKLFLFNEYGIDSLPF